MILKPARHAVKNSSQTEAWDGLDPNQFLRFSHKFLAKVASGSGNTRTECFQRAEILSYFPSAPVILSKPAMSFVKKLKACDGWSYDTLTPLLPKTVTMLLSHIYSRLFRVFSSRNATKTGNRIIKREACLLFHLIHMVICVENRP